MKNIFVLIFALFLASCKEPASQPPASQPPLSQIVAYVHWETQGLAGKEVILLQTGDTLKTDSTGIVIFSVPPGHYVIRALSINRGGPINPALDFEVDTRSGESTKVDIVDCLPCL